MASDDGVAALERIVVGAVGLTTRALAEAAPGTDLTFPQWRALLIVGEDGEGTRVGQVAARVGVTLPATSRLLRRLADRGLVALETDEADHRATRARLTDRGIAVRTAILAYRRLALSDIADGLRRSGGGPVPRAVETLADAFATFA